jgi:VanZ family protein
VAYSYERNGRFRPWVKGGQQGILKNRGLNGYEGACTFVMYRSISVSAKIRWLVVVLWMSVIFVLSSIPSLHVPFAHSYDFLLRKLAHIGEYAVLTVALLWAFQMYTDSRIRAWLLAALAALLYGVSDEWHQSWILGRRGSLKDVGIDAVGIAASYALVQRQTFKGLSIIEKAMSRWQCPVCQRTRLYRSQRRGLLEWCSRLIRLAPFRCDICSHRFWRFSLRGRYALRHKGHGGEW